LKLRLSTKYFRTRVVIWSSLFAVFIALITAIKSIIESDNKGLLYCLAILFVFVPMTFAGIQTYKENFSRLDKKRWQKPGIKPKLEVISDWIIN
jgi:xanthine/uracil permease